jgi:(p)ppGpp synthase/HD superfamily hydrolase
MRLDEDFEDDHKLIYDFASKKHSGQVRKSSGVPYIEHPKSVAMILEAYGAPEYMVEAALTHDTLEDTDTTWDNLVDLFGEDCANLVSELTNDKQEVARLGKENYMSRHMLDLSDDALTVKIADCYHNALDNPKPGQVERMARNLAVVKRNRRLNDLQSDLMEAFESVAG